MMETARVVVIDDARIDAAVDVLAAAFDDYPVFTYVLPPDTAGRDSKLAAIMRHYLWRRRVRNWPVLGVEERGMLRAVVAANPPNDGSPPPGIEDEERRLVEIVGAAAENRRRRYESNSGGGFPELPRFFVGMLASHPRARGKGHAARLMREIEARAQAHPLARGVALCTETETNLAFYHSLGYQVVSSGEVSGVNSWSLWRANNA